MSFKKQANMFVLTCKIRDGKDTISWILIVLHSSEFINQNVIKIANIIENAMVYIEKILNSMLFIKIMRIE